MEEATPKVEVWPAHEKVTAVFDRMQSQWRHSINGIHGFEYEALPVIMKLLRIDEEEWPDIFEDLRVMEVAALRKIRQIREQEKSK